MKTKLSVMLAVFALLIFVSPAFAQKHGKGGGKGNKGNKSGQHQQRGGDHSMNQKHNDRDRHFGDHHRHPHHWGNGSHWNWYAGTGGFGFYYGPRYGSCHNYYYPVAPWRPVAYYPWTHYYYFYGPDSCPIHRYRHAGYCEYYYDDGGGVELFWFPR